MSLVRAERRRFAKRRLTRWMVVAALILLGLVVTGTFFSNHKPTPAVIAQAEADAQRNYEATVADFKRQKERCEATPTTEECNYYMNAEVPPRSEFKAEWYMPSSFDFKESYAELLVVWAAIIAMIGFVLGASFVGAEWASGSMMNLLTWRPKRTGVLATKFGVLLSWMTVISVGTLALWTGALWLTAYLRGSNAGMTEGTWMSFGLAGLRGLGMILVFCAVGFLLASIGRHTGLALGAALAVVIVGQVGVSIVLGMAGVKFFEQYLIPVHFYAWMNKSVTLESYPRTCTGMCEPEKLIVSWGETGSIAAGVVVFLLVIAFWQMRRRDVA